MIVAALALAVPATAAAADGYTDVTGVTQGTGDGPSGTSSSPSTEAVSSASEDTSGSVLPFTGLQLALMLVAGIALLGTGLALRRTRTR